MYALIYSVQNTYLHSEVRYYKLIKERAKRISLVEYINICKSLTDYTTTTEQAGLKLYTFTSYKTKGV